MFNECFVVRTGSIEATKKFCGERNNTMSVYNENKVSGEAVFKNLINLRKEN